MDWGVNECFERPASECVKVPVSVAVRSPSGRLVVKDRCEGWKAWLLVAFGSLDLVDHNALSRPVVRRLLFSMICFGTKIFFHETKERRSFLCVIEQILAKNETTIGRFDRLTKSSVKVSTTPPYLMLERSDRCRGTTHTIITFLPPSGVRASMSAKISPSLSHPYAEMKFT